MSIILDGTLGITTPGETNTGTETVVNLITSGNTILGDASTDTLNVGNGGLVKDASGNVGIGTASPVEKLTVVGQISATSDLVLKDSGLTDRGYIFGTSVGLTYRATSGLPHIFQNAGTELMRIDSSGNVGIGTASPSSILSGSNVNLTVEGTNGADISLKRSGGAARVGLGVTSGNECYLYSSTATPLVFATNGTERMRIDSTGKVGIGTASPMYDLQVGSTSATLALAGALTTNSTSRLKFLASNTVTNWQISQNDSIAGAFEIIPSTVAGGSTFTTPAAVITSAGLFQFNSGYGSAATAYGCRAWVNFNGGGTPAIRASGNVSSITDNGTGDYTVNFTTAMVDANYSVAGIVGGADTPAANAGIIHVKLTSGLTTGSVRFYCTNISSAAADRDYILINVHR